jgi:hypothetical protein
MVLGIKMEFDQNRDESRQSVKANKMYSPALCNRMYKRVGSSQKITSIPTMPLFLLLLLVMILILIPATTQMISTASAFSSSSIITTHGGGIFIPKRRRQRLNKASFLFSINDQQEEEATPISTETAREDHHHLATDDSNSSSNSNIYHDWLFTDRKQRVIFYGSLALLETMFWYYLAPGIDPQSRYFNPIDGELITNQLLNPSIVLSPPIGSGLGFSSLLLNSFLILPMVWSLLLLQEIINSSSSSSSSNSNNNNNCATNNNNNNINIPKFITVFVCACGFFVGGGALIPYMMFRRPSSSSTPFITGRSQSIIHPDNNNNSSSLLVPLLQFFEKEEIMMIQKEEKEENDDDDDNDDDVGMKLLYPLLPPGQIFLVTLLSVIVFTFVFPFIYNTINNNDYDWSIEWDAFLSRIKNSQFTSLALFDFTMISIVIIDPIIDDAIRRGYINFGNDDGIYDKGTATTSTATDIKRFELVRKLLPFVVIPLIGPVMWICLRPPMQ